MKKSILALLSLTFLTFASVPSYAQLKVVNKSMEIHRYNPNAKKPAMDFEQSTHDFGYLKEGDPAVAEFTFKNTGDTAIVIQNVKPSCGCTTPYWPKEPIEPGKTAVVKAAYGTQGRVGHFHKNVTVISNVGKKVLYIEGTVKKAPQTPAPKNNSMIRH